MANQDWEFVEDSYWHVPMANLGVFASMGGTLLPLVDQTLRHITEVAGGHDAIKDFDAKGGAENQDYIGVGSDVIEWLQIFQYGQDTVVSFRDRQTVLQIGVKASQVGEADFVETGVM